MIKFPVAPANTTPPLFVVALFKKVHPSNVRSEFTVILKTPPWKEVLAFWNVIFLNTIVLFAAEILYIRAVPVAEIIASV